MKILTLRSAAVALLFTAAAALAFRNGTPGPVPVNGDSLYIAANFEKAEVMIPMRDGVRLFTQIYAPKDKSRKYPILLNRTPYSCSPYGKDGVHGALGPAPQFIRAGYVFVHQDVRGRYLSEGEFVNMRPQLTGSKDKKAIDESTDTWDTIDWLVKNVANNNGKAGIWGISYPGFYAAAGCIGTHPALKAVSPQAPIADWFWDDFHHHGAFFLPHAFNFFASFGLPRHGPTTKRNPRFDHGTPDGYRFFLEELGPLKNANPRFLHDSVAFWNEMAAHPNYDEFWQARNLLPHLNNVTCAVLTVGGWFDAEDLYGSLKIYGEMEYRNPGIKNNLVMGPWRHGGWRRDDGSRLGNVFFGSDPPPSLHYQEKIQLPFFEHHLKSADDPKLPEATVFQTGVNRWRTFDTWPPHNLEIRKLYFHADHSLSFSVPQGVGVHSFDSDPARPVPYSETITTGMTKEYMTDDQRFAARRPDVLVYRTAVLEEDITLAGPLPVHLVVSTTQGDADWIVKLIDVYPDDHPGYPFTKDHLRMGGYQQMVRSEVIRGRFRNSYEKPEPFTPNQATDVKLELPDVLHTFRKGHRIMIQIQSTWFPLVDRNPQKYVENIFGAEESDFVKATHSVYVGGARPTYLSAGILRE